MACLYCCRKCHQKVYMVSLSIELLQDLSEARADLLHGVLAHLQQLRCEDISPVLGDKHQVDMHALHSMLSFSLNWLDPA